MRRDDPFPALDAAALAGVTGGRFTPMPGQGAPVLQAIGQLEQLIEQVGQSLVAAKQAGQQQMLQLMQQMMMPAPAASAAPQAPAGLAGLQAPAGYSSSASGSPS